MFLEIHYKDFQKRSNSIILIYEYILRYDFCLTNTYLKQSFLFSKSVSNMFFRRCLFLQCIWSQSGDAVGKSRNSEDLAGKCHFQLKLDTKNIETYNN